MPRKHPPQPAFHQPVELAYPPMTPPLGCTVEVDAHHPYLKTRGLTPETIADFGLGFSRSEACLKSRILIPVHNAAGDLVGYAGRWPGDPLPRERSKYRFHGPIHDELFNLHRVLQVGGTFPVLLVPGFFDLFHLRQRGCECVVALLGTELRSLQLRRLLHHFPTRQFVVLYDATETGREGRERTVNRLSSYAFVRAPEFLTDGRTVQSLTREEIMEEL